MKWAFIVFVALYAAALGLLAVGTFGFFGQEQDPLAGVFLLPLGLPWNLVGDWIATDNPIVALIAPAINAAILFCLWKRRG